MFSGLSPLLVEDVVEEIVVWARTPDGAAGCPDCGAGKLPLPGAGARLAQRYR